MSAIDKNKQVIINAFRNSKLILILISCIASLFSYEKNEYYKKSFFYQQFNLMKRDFYLHSRLFLLGILTFVLLIIIVLKVR